MFRLLGGFKKKIPPCLSIYSNERTKDRPLMPLFFTRNLFVPCIYIYTWKCNRRNICFTVLEIAHNVWELQFLFPRMLSRSSELTMLIMNWNWLNSLYPIQVSIDFDTLLNEIGEIRLGFSCYQQSVTPWSSLGNKKINSIHFIFFSKCIYIISRRDGKCCIHRSENNILEAESEYESLSLNRLVVENKRPFIEPALAVCALDKFLEATSLLS